MEVISTELWVLLGHEFALCWPSKTSLMALRACTANQGEETRDREAGSAPYLPSNSSSLSPVLTTPYPTPALQP